MKDAFSRALCVIQNADRQKRQHGGQGADSDEKQNKHHQVRQPRPVPRASPGILQDGRVAEQD